MGRVVSGAGVPTEAQGPLSPADVPAGAPGEAGGHGDLACQQCRAGRRGLSVEGNHQIRHNHRDHSAHSGGIPFPPEIFRERRVGRIREGIAKDRRMG